MAATRSPSRTPRPAPHRPLSISDDECDDSSSCASESSVDEDAVNSRISPNWCSYKDVIACRGFRLDTCKDVKDWYHRYWASQVSEGRTVTKDLPGYLRACRSQDENELCRDAGLVSWPHPMRLWNVRLMQGLDPSPTGCSEERSDLQVSRW